MPRIFQKNGAPKTTATHIFLVFVIISVTWELEASQAAFEKMGCLVLNPTIVVDVERFVFSDPTDRQAFANSWMRFGYQVNDRFWEALR